MNLWRADKIMDRMNEMLDSAIEGRAVEKEFDETKMSQIEAKLAKYLAMNQLGKAQLQEEKEKINVLISDISHQTKTPVANLLLYSELLGQTSLGGTEREIVEAIGAQARKLSFLISDLVKASRLESGIIGTTPEECPLQELLGAVLPQIEAKAAEKNIDIICRDTNLSAVFDLKWTGEALFNILDNAVKYTKAGGSVKISVNAYPMFVRIDVSDNGMGIAEEEIPKIFGRFYRSAAAVPCEGVGLGLYIARQIIQSQGGYIKVSSKEGEGSVFSVFLRR